MKILLTLIPLFTLTLAFANEPAPKKLTRLQEEVRVYTRAEITGIEKRNIGVDHDMLLVETKIHLKILDGEYAGQVKTAVLSGEDIMPGEMRYREGNRVFIGISRIEGEDSTGYISIYDIDNTRGIIVLSFLLVTAVLTLGRWKGLFSLFALLFTILLLFFVLIPLTLKGHSPLPIAVAISVVSVIVTMPIIMGFSLKTLSAILGASGGIVIASLLAMIFGWTMHLSGIITNEMLTVFYASDVHINLRGLALSGMIISALGAIMDVCISIASATTEIYAANPAISSREAFKSVLNIGTDILGSMVNTLILAYVGSSLSLILLISMRFNPDMPVWMIFNYNPVLSEIVKSVVGSIGMFTCIPLTAYIAVRIHEKWHGEKAAKGDG